MAKKRAKKVNPTTAKTKPVRLDLPLEDHERLEERARSLGLKMASFVRMVVLKALKEMEEKG